MGQNLVNLRIDLEIAGQQIANHLQLYNEEINKQAKEGIELAIKELTEEDNFVNIVKDSTKEHIRTLINKAAVSWEFKNGITKMIQDKISAKVDEYSDQIAEKLTKDLKLG